MAGAEEEANAGAAHKLIAHQRPAVGKDAEIQKVQGEKSAAHAKDPQTEHRGDKGCDRVTSGAQGAGDRLMDVDKGQGNGADNEQLCHRRIERGIV